MKQRDNIKDKIGDWAVLLFGLVLMATQVYEYISGQIEGSVVEIGVFVVGFLLVRYPSALTDIVKGIGAKFTK